MKGLKFERFEVWWVPINRNVGYSIWKVPGSAVFYRLSFVFVLCSWFLVPGSWFFCPLVALPLIRFRFSAIKTKWEGDIQPDVALPLGDQPVKDSVSEVGVRLKRGWKVPINRDVAYSIWRVWSSEKQDCRLLLLKGKISMKQATNVNPGHKKIWNFRYLNFRDSNHNFLNRLQ